MRILVDADGCPVVEEAIRAAALYHISVVLFHDTAHEYWCRGVENVMVSTGADSVDYVLVNRVCTGDIVVTQDYGLAAICLARGAFPLRQDGLAYTQENIDDLLMLRYASKRARDNGERLKGPHKRTRREDKAFFQALCSLLESLA